jgi:hypothetical protein
MSMDDRGISILFPVIFLCLLTGCTQLDKRHASSPDFLSFKDQSFSAREKIWLEEGKQSRITASIRKAQGRIVGKNRRELLYKAVDYIRNHFRYDSWYLDKAFMFTADDIFTAGIMGGCSDFAVAEVALFRALGIPARIALTVNTDWIAGYKENDLIIPRGHVFIEVYLENDWYLFDPVYRILYQGYDPNENSFPRKEFLVIRTRDFFDVGIKNLSDVIQIFQRFALNFDPEHYTSPQYVEIPVNTNFSWE